MSVHFEAGIAVELHVPFPLRSTCESGLSIAGITCSCSAPLRFAADSEAFQKNAVEPDVEQLFPTHPLEVILIVALQADRESVVAVDREVVPHGDAACVEFRVGDETYWLKDGEVLTEAPAEIDATVEADAPGIYHLLIDADVDAVQVEGDRSAVERLVARETVTAPV